MRNYPDPLIALESWPHTIDISVGMPAVVTVFSAAGSKPFSFIAQLIPRFFRDPARSRGDVCSSLIASPNFVAGKKVSLEKIILANL